MKEKEPIFKKGVPVIVKDRKSLYELKENLSKFELWELALSTPTFCERNADSGMCKLAYTNEVVVELPERCLLDYNVSESYKRLNGYGKYDNFMYFIVCKEIASRKAAEIAIEEYREVCKESRLYLYFDLVARHILSIIREFDLKDLSVRRTVFSFERFICDHDFPFYYQSPVFLEKLIIGSIMLYSRFHEKECDMNFFNDTIEQMIQRRRESIYTVYYEYMENSMCFDNFHVLRCRICDKIKKYALSKDGYPNRFSPGTTNKEGLINDLSDIIFYGIMALASVCRHEDVGQITTDFFNDK